VTSHGSCGDPQVVDPPLPPDEAVPTREIWAPTKLANQVNHLRGPRDRPQQESNPPRRPHPRGHRATPMTRGPVPVRWRGHGVGSGLRQHRRGATCRHARAQRRQCGRRTGVPDVATNRIRLPLARLAPGDPAYRSAREASRMAGARHFTWGARPADEDSCRGLVAGGQADRAGDRSG
jgi:hypothetical protein